MKNGHGLRRALGLEGLESRDLMSSQPLPVLLVIADQHNFYYKEYADTRTSLLQDGVGVVVAATTTNTSYPHPNTGEVEAGVSGAVTPDVALADARPGDYSAIAFVGGWGSSMYQYAYNDPNADGVTDNLYFHGPYNGDDDLNDGVIAPQKVAANDLINDFLAADKPVAAICHGVTVLAWARVDGVSPLAGKTVSVPHTVGTPGQFYAAAERYAPYLSGQYDQVVANGGRANAVTGQHGTPGTAHDDVVVDGRIITAENYDSAAMFGRVIAREVKANLPPPDVLIPGTPADDLIYVWSNGTPDGVSAWVNGVSYGPFQVSGGAALKVLGGDGNDRIYATDSSVPVQLIGGDGHDLLVGGSGGDLIDGGAGVDRGWGGPGRDVLLGGDGDDYLYGREGNDVLVGGAGNDWLDGYDGDDVLVGGTGADWVSGQAGDDLLVGGTTTHDSDPKRLASLLDDRTSSDPAARDAAPVGTSFIDDGEQDVLCGGVGADWIVPLGVDLYCADPSDRVGS